MYEVLNHQILSVAQRGKVIEKQHTAFVSSLVLVSTNAEITIGGVHRETDGETITELPAVPAIPVNCTITNPRYEPLTCAITPPEMLDLSAYAGAGKAQVRAEAADWESAELEVIL